ACLRAWAFLRATSRPYLDGTVTPILYRAVLIKIRLAGHGDLETSNPPRVCRARRVIPVAARVGAWVDARCGGRDDGAGAGRLLWTGDGPRRRRRGRSSDELEAHRLARGSGGRDGRAGCRRGRAAHARCPRAAGRRGVVCTGRRRSVEAAHGAG